VIDRAQADATLTASLTRVPRTSPRDRTLLRSSVLVFASLLAFAVLGGGAIQASAGWLSGGVTIEEAGSAALSLSRAGYVRVIAEPWADVFVDGELALTTPAAMRIPLSPGKHYVKFVNPFYAEQTAEVVVRSGETQLVHAVLAPKHTHAATRGAAHP
jgi:PEGA domain